MYVAGHFDLYALEQGQSTWKSIGSTRDGFRIRASAHKQDVQDDAYGEAIADQVILGVDYSIAFEFVEYDKIISSGILKTVGTADIGDVKTNVGIMASKKSFKLAMIPVAGTTAADTSVMGGSGKAYIVPMASISSDIEFLFASKLNQGPMTLTALPDRTSGTTHADKAIYIDTAPTIS